MKYANSGIGTILYILIVVIATIISAAKKKVKKTTTDKVEPQSKPVKTWEEILAETLDIPGTNENDPKAEPVIQQVEFQDIMEQVKEVNRAESPKPDFLKNIQTIGKHEYHSIDIIKESQKSKSEEEIKYSSIDFDVKKAVIFSEILNKKYY